MENTILTYIKDNPYISQSELAQKVGLSRPAVANYISKLVKSGKIVGRAYILQDESRIICIGGANVDRKAKLTGPVQIGTSNIASFTQSCGGVARNVAENLGRLGCPTSLITCTGDDKDGTWLLNHTAEHNVDTSQSFTLPAQATGTYTTILQEDGYMFIALDNMQIYENIDIDIIKTKLSYILSAHLVFVDANFSSDILAYIIEQSKYNNLNLCLSSISSYRANKLPSDLEGVSLLVGTKEEFEIIAGSVISRPSDYLEVCKKIRRKGVKNIVLYLQKEGIFFLTEDGNHEFIRFADVNAVDTTGASDALIAAILFGLSRGESFYKSCRMGIAAASLTMRTNETVYPNLTGTHLYNMTD